MSGILDAMRRALDRGRPAVLVTVVAAKGSTPREEGAAMLVEPGASTGTIGGGALEHAAIAEANAMIETGRFEAMLDIPLGPRIGQCCGGHVSLALRLVTDRVLAEAEQVDRAERHSLPQALIFGAGHTGRAMAEALALLPLRVVIVDTRAEMLAGLPPAVETRLSALPEAEVARAPEGSAYLVMTHDHGLDFLIAAAALSRDDAAYVGMIGSATKAETFRRHLEGEGLGATFERLRTPIGGKSLRDKRPAVIAAMTAADILPLLLRPAAQAQMPRIDVSRPRTHHARAS